MYLLLAPAKTFNTNYQTGNNSLFFFEETNYLLAILKSKSLSDITTIFKTSEKLSLEILNYFKNYQETKSALSLYGGTVFKEITSKVSNQVFILSALYGIINANSNISEYRLDFTNKILNESLYQFWDQKIDNFIKTMLTDKPVINLASSEFSKLIDLNNPNVYTIDFQVLKNNKLTRPSTIVKTMRGKFANFIIENNLSKVEELKKIKILNFKFREMTNNKLIFIKEQL